MTSEPNKGSPMRAWVSVWDGDRSRLDQRTVERRTANAREVEIRVHATSINPVDIKLLRRSANTQGALTIPHCDVAGVISSVGSEVHDFSVGDRVYGCAGGVGNLPGALADYMVADADLIAPMPARLSFREAAALPLVSITAWEALVDKAGVQSGDDVLIIGGSGGVGHVALQLAKALGAKVCATTSTAEKAALARRFGADAVIIRGSENIVERAAALTSERGFDVVFDTAGCSEDVFTVVRNNGAAIFINDPKAQSVQPAYRKGVSSHFVMALLPMLTGRDRAVHGAILRQIATMVDKREITPLIDPRRFTFSDANEAHAYFEEGRAIGKVILENSDDS